MFDKAKLELSVQISNSGQSEVYDREQLNGKKLSYA